MAGRAGDWLRQAESDLAHARNASNDGDFDWACFAAQQSAAKAAHAAVGQETWGHVVTELLEGLRPRETTIDDALLDRARSLDKHHIPTRYPNGLPAGAPADFLHARRGRAGHRGCQGDPFRDRIPAIARHFTGIGVGCDVLVYTEGERTRLAGRFARAVLDEGIQLAARTSPPSPPPNRAPG